MIKAKLETIGDPGLNCMHFGTIVCDRLAGLGSGQLGRCAMLVSGAQKQDFVAPGTQVAGEKIRRAMAAIRSASQ